MKKLVSLTQKAAAFFLLAVVLIGSIPPTPPPDPDTPGVTESETPGEPGDKGDEVSPCSDREGEEVHKN